MQLALFDFDGTLTTRDSLLPFLRHLVGTPRFVAGLLACSTPLLGHALGRMANDVAKERVLKHFLGGHRIDALQASGAAFAAAVLPRLERPALLQVLQRHRDSGDVCMLVSASLDIYLQPWARQHGFHAVLCSGLAQDAQGRATGAIVPRNCHGAEKARRIQEWLAGRQGDPVTSVTAYGDSRGDWEMLALADQPHWIGKPPRAPRRLGAEEATRRSAP